jgi:hypothetical protein
MRRPPAAVGFVARTHWVVAATIGVAQAVLFPLARKLPMVEFGARTYLIAAGLGTLYLLAGTLVWFGAPLGRFLSRLCGLLYLARPQLGSHLWNIMNSPEFQAHFTRSAEKTTSRNEG